MYIDETRLPPPAEIKSEPITVTEYDSSLLTSQDVPAAVAQSSGYQTLANIKSTALLVQRNECNRKDKLGETDQSNFAVFKKVNIVSTYSKPLTSEYSELVSGCIGTQHSVKNTS